MPVVVGVTAFIPRSEGCTGRFPTIAVRTSTYKQSFLAQGLREGVDLIDSLGFEDEGVNIGIIIGAAVGGVLLIILVILLLFFCLRRRKRKGNIDADAIGKVPGQGDAMDQDPQVTVDPSAADPYLLYGEQQTPAEVYQANGGGSSIAQAPATDISLGGPQAPVDHTTGQYGTTLPEVYSSQPIPQGVSYSVPLDTSQPTYPSQEQMPQPLSQTIASPEEYPNQAYPSNVTNPVPFDASQQSNSSPEQIYQPSTADEINYAPVSNTPPSFNQTYALPQTTQTITQHALPQTSETVIQNTQNYNGGTQGPSS